MTHKLLILSDSHLFGSRYQELFGVNTYQTLHKLSTHIGDAGGSYDLAVASGDLSEDGLSGAYEEFHDLTQGLASSFVWMKGNHDQFDNVSVELTKKYIHPEWHLDPWSLIFLDTTLKGRDEGELGESELLRLEEFMEKYSDKHLLIFMHHQPIEVGSEFIDELGLLNHQEFWELVLRYQNLRGVIFGHVHQEYDSNVGEVRLLSTPSTAMQFKPFSRELDLDLSTLGYRNLTLNPDGSIDTKIHRIAAVN